ncbi:MAG: carbohydrate ABC transporter permease [Anaerolineaceae bacterium]|nr:carbohydrate ABC transporter permease [Anaerolineaceae bacterium]
MTDKIFHSSIISITKYLALTLVAILWVGLPLWMLVVNSFKPLTEAGLLSTSLPQQWRIVENYTTVIEEGNYLTGLTNSLLVTLPTIIVVILLGAAAAWAYARSRSNILKVTYFIAALSILLPPALLPTIFLLQNLGIDGTRIGYLLVTIGTRLGGMIFLTTGFIRSLPIDFEEAAAIDGASKIRIFWNIILPLLTPILFVNAILLLISVWNEFFFASFLMPSNELQTLPLALYRFSATGAQYSSKNWHLIFAHVVLTSLPLLIVYIFAQNRIISSLSTGGVKG